MPYTKDDLKLKKLLKAAVVEVLEERRDLVSDAVVEAVEDLALVRAIREGSQSGSVSRAEVLKTLRAPR
jgi:hypothetical protein